jgi:hypothetical protein
MIAERNFLLNQVHAKLLAEFSTPRPLVSMKMFLLAIRMLMAILFMFFPAGFFLFCGLTEEEWNAGKITMIAALAIVATAMLIGCIPAFIREYKLIRFGQVIFGEVVSSKSETNTYHDQAPADAGGAIHTWTETVVTIDYAFSSPAGSRISGTVTQKFTDTSKTIPQPGEQMVVLFLDHELHEVL